MGFLFEGLPRKDYVFGVPICMEASISGLEAVLAWSILGVYGAQYGFVVLRGLGTARKLKGPACEMFYTSLGSGFWGPFCLMVWGFAFPLLPAHHNFFNVFVIAVDTPPLFFSAPLLATVSDVGAV